MKKIFVILCGFILLLSISANVRLDSMQLNNGEIYDKIGDFLFSPTLFHGKKILIYINNKDNIYSKFSDNVTDNNNFTITDYSKNTADGYLTQMLFALKMKKFVFGVNIIPFILNSTGDIISKRFIKVTSTYLKNEETIGYNKMFLNMVNFSFGIDMGLMNFALSLGYGLNKGEMRANYYDYTDSSNNAISGTSTKGTMIVISPDILFKTNFGKILFSFKITPISNDQKEDYNGSIYETEYKGKKTIINPVLFYSKKFSFGLLRSGISLSSSKKTRDYYYDPSLNENKWDYSKKSSIFGYFCTLSQWFKRGILVEGLRVKAGSDEEKYNYDQDTTDSAYTNYDYTNKSNIFELLLSFEQRINRFIKFFGGVDWQAVNYLENTKLEKDENGAITKNTIQKIKNPKLLYGVGVGIRIWKMGTLNFSITNLSEGYGIDIDNLDQLAMNNVDTSNEKKFVMYWEFVR